MECRKCGNILEEGIQVCPNCGTVAEEMREMTGSSAWEGIPRSQESRPLTRKEFFKHGVMRRHRDYLSGAAIAIYFCTLCSFVASFSFSNIAGVFDSLLVLGLGIGMQLGRSRVCAVILALTGALNVIGTLFTGAVGLFGVKGLLFVASILGVKETFEMNEAWNTYQKVGDYPGIW